MEKNGVIFDFDKYQERVFIDSHEEEYRKIENEKERRISEIREQAIERDKDNRNNIRHMVLKELEETGFNTGYDGTRFLANLIEYIYYELDAFDASTYFDLSDLDNKHYSLLLEGHKSSKDEEEFRTSIIVAIGTSKSDDKNINSLVYTIASNVKRRINNKKELVLKNEEK